VSVWEDGGFDENDRDLNCARNRCGCGRGGDELSSAGLLLECNPNGKPKTGDFQAEIFLLERI
jgi:hypothetical protein